MTEFLRIFLPIYGVLFFFALFYLRTFIVWKRTGVNAYVLLNQQGVYGIIGRYFKLMPILSVITIALYAFFPRYYNLTGQLTWLEHPSIAAIGCVLLISSLIWTWIAQMQMGNSWRIGIDQDSSTALVTSGVFSYSRNPIFLGIRIAHLGFLLSLPNALTLTVLLLGSAMIEAQVALEEEYLEKSHGEAYQHYKTSVRRWI